jgi:hypothetical protein
VSNMPNKPDPSTRRRPGFTAMAVLVTMLVVLLAAATWAALTSEGELALNLSAAGVGVAVLIVLLAVVRRPPVLDARVVDGELRVRFGGWDVVWTLRREIRIPLEHIRRVQVYRPENLWTGWWHRRLGTVIPGTIKAGWFRGPDERELWDVRAGADVIDIRLAHPAPMARLVLQVPDPTALADVLQSQDSHVRTQAE